VCDAAILHLVPGAYFTVISRYVITYRLSMGGSHYSVFYKTGPVTQFSASGVGRGSSELWMALPKVLLVQIGSRPATSTSTPSSFAFTT